MNQQPEQQDRDAVRGDGFAMLAVLALTVALIVFLVIQVV